MSAPSLNSVSSSQRAQSFAMEKAKAYVALTKPGITVFMIFTAICAAIVAEGKMPDVWIMVKVAIGLALSSGGAAAINMWYDRDIDKIMKRTMERPLPTGQLRPQSALLFGIGLQVLSLIWFLVFVNVLSALLSLAGFLYYTVIYTMWLKRKTPQNIVIGGGAGAIPPMIGWAAVTGEIGWAAVILFAIIFFWTPPHFWPLVIAKNDDYVRAGIPMLPVVRGIRNTKRQCMIYTVLLLLTSFALYFTDAAGGFYLAGAILSGLAFLYFQIRMWYEPDDCTVWAKRTFLASLVYLPALFLFMVIDSCIWS